jgi:hypothetical protein
LRETEPARPGYARRVPSSLPGDGFAEPQLADTAVIAPDRTPTPTTYAEPQLFASSIEPETRRPSGLAIWFVAAFCLVVGIGIGFVSGYRVATGGSFFDFTSLPWSGSPAAATKTAAPQRTTPQQPATESSVSGPVRLESEQIVPGPDAPAAPPSGIQKPAEPARQSRAVAGQPREPQRAPEPAPRAAAAQAAPAKPAPPVEPPAAAAGPGLLQVLSRPAGAQVFLDGRLVGTTPLSLSDVAPGQHNVRLELAGFNGWATTVDVKGGASAKVAASLEQP